MMTKRRDLRKRELGGRRKNKKEEEKMEGVSDGCIIKAGDLVQYLARIDERQKKIQKDVEEIKSQIFGDGRDGLIIEINSMKTTLRNVIFGLAFVFTVLSLVVVLMNIFTW